MANVIYLARNMPNNEEPVYRTVYTVEVFSRGPYEPIGSEEELAQINYDITYGDCIGNVECRSTEIVPPEKIEAELLRIGNDGSFFESA